jgi:CHAT domain-containing protein
MLSAAEYHILHFAGYDMHAYSNFVEDEGVILLGERGERDDLVQLLQGFPQLRLAVFNTCFTTDSLAPALIQCGVPSVIAWRGFNQDAVAVRFTSVFYALLVKLNWRVDAALAETRRILYT